MRRSLSARIARESGTSFYYAFRVLSARKRRAIYAVYSFCRVVDDCVDEQGGRGAAGLADWLEEARRCYDGRPQTELGRELAEAVARYPIPLACFEEIVAGCRMDLERSRYASFEELLLYCRRVASAVGLACVEVFGYRNPATREYASELGVALQLTNILRDVGSDAARGRLYLPLEDLARFGVPEAELLAATRGGPRDGRIDALLRFEGERARERYALAALRLPEEDRRAMLSAQVMKGIYRELLARLESRGYPLAGPRVRVPGWRKAWVALAELAGSAR
jgi:phytoene synthase